MEGLTNQSKSTAIGIGARIRKLRHEQGLTQEKLAGPEFTKGYVSALERGAVRPSLKALDVFARRLNVTIVDLISAKQETDAEIVLEALQEDILFQIDYAKLLIRSGSLDEAMQFLDEVEERSKPQWEKLSTDILYQLPFLRARIYSQSSDLKMARTELDRALELAKSSEDATARVRNLLGIVFYQQEQPQFALEEHLQCLHAIRKGVIKDLNFRLSVYRNLANDYWAQNNFEQAIAIYKEALTVLHDLNDLQQQAGIFWGMAMAYRASQDWAHAKLYATRALQIYETADNKAESASICINLADILIEEQRYAEAQDLLERAEEYLAGLGNKGLLSLLHRHRAELSRRQGEIEMAKEDAARSIKYAEELIQDIQTSGASSNQPWVDPIRAYAEALHIGALVEEDQGHTESADGLFQRALEQISQTGVDETRYAITLSYAEVLSKRGALEQAVQYYRAAAQARLRPPRVGF